eukprot:GHVT01105254.1.p1 GENE.GHVT01105254.1~~GHVT01105254.1.p1  ORF type:complete len:108 (+),score=4.72 GHVT01105254.1:197-520(+)
MRARRLKHNLVFKKVTQGKSSLGTPTKDLIDAFDFSIPSDIQSVRENETFVSDKTKTLSEIKFIIRYFSQIDTSMSIFFDNKTYEIVEIINPYFSNKELVIYAKVVS